METLRLQSEAERGDAKVHGEKLETLSGQLSQLLVRTRADILPMREASQALEARQDALHVTLSEMKATISAQVKLLEKGLLVSPRGNEAKENGDRMGVAPWEAQRGLQAHFRTIRSADVGRMGWIMDAEEVGRLGNV